MRRVAYVFPLFPVLNQTFTLAEVAWLKERGYDIQIVSLLSRVADQQQPEALALAEQTHYCPRLLSLPLWSSVGRAFVRNPGGVLALVPTVVRAWRAKLPERNAGAGAGPETFGWRDWLDLLYRGNSFSYLLKSLTMIPYALYLAEYLRREGIEHVHCQWATYPATVGLLLKQWAGITYSIAAHAYDIYLMPRMLPAKLEEALFVVTCADYNRKFLSTLCSESAASRIYLNYHGTDLDRFVRSRRGKSERLRIVSVGWMKEYKGFHVVVEALARLIAKGVDAELHLAGDGPQRGYLEAQAQRLGVAERVIFHGFVDHKALRDIYDQADVLAMGSIEMNTLGRQDVIPNVLAEAMAMELPVVSTRMGGIPELIEDGEQGLLVPQRDPQAMADALERIAGEPETVARLVEAASRKVVRVWDRQANLRDLVAIFEQRLAQAEEAAA